MKVFRVYHHDRHDTFGYRDFTNREAAEQYVHWHNTHPTPDSEMGWYDITETEVKIHDSFVPMSDEEYQAKYADFLTRRKAETKREAELAAYDEYDDYDV